MWFYKKKEILVEFKSKSFSNLDSLRLNIISWDNLIWQKVWLEIIWIWIGCVVFLFNSGNPDLGCNSYFEKIKTNKNKRYDRKQIWVKK